MSINVFIDALTKATVSPQVFNQYSLDFCQNETRRENLRAYLQAVVAIKPAFMLVGEAPGYRGARLTGIPFASPSTLTLYRDVLGIKRLQMPDEWPHIRKEASATIMWETLRQVTAVPLIWNVFPFHPHKPGSPQSNRRPTRQELAEKRPLFQQIHELFSIQTIVAVGNTAAETLTRWHIPHKKVRHPSHGGKTEFQTGLFKLLVP